MTFHLLSSPHTGKNRDYNVDLIPKFIMACGVLVKILIHTKISSYLEFKSIAGSYVFKGGKKEIFKVPATMTEATKTPLMGMFQKTKFMYFLKTMKDIDVGLHAAKPDAFRCPQLDGKTMGDLYYDYGLDENTQDFLGHAMCLETSEEYKKRKATPSIRALHLYCYSLDRYGTSPYLYPKWGLGGLPESFSRMAAVYGGCFMLDTTVDEILTDATGAAVGIRHGSQAASCKYVIGDPSYFDKSKTKVAGQIARSIMILNHPLRSTDGAESAQIIVPANQIAQAGFAPKKKDIYVMAVSSENQVCAKGQWIAIVSTEVETSDPMKELACGIDIVGDYLERFDSVSDYRVPVNNPSVDKMFISESYDATSHFETTTDDVLRMYEAITGKSFDLTINADAVGADA